ncbi:hypothetical protein QJS10_CPB20g01089 [Acorus calamus]|uniref:Uncharacterized protein n=1 Tax=Acorus calamus TaxID=4465 RepID=A0AAV9C9W3_ACOCL|nr:hypothetical protein QJS10_CPB20g01089 [Acorus calamus]
MEHLLLNALSRGIFGGNLGEGMLTGLLGNLSLLSYFAKKRETEAVFVQTLGVISTYIVILQLAMAEAMPLPQFVVTSVVVGFGLVLNFLNYFSLLNEVVWRSWEDFITIGGLAVLPQVMWSTFVPFIPSSILPGTLACTMAIVAVVMWTNYLNPDNIKGLSAFSMLLGMIGNGLLIPRALFIRDLMWNGSVERHQSLWLQFTSQILEGVDMWTLTK